MGAGVIDDFGLLKNEMLKQLQKDPVMHQAMAVELRKEFEGNLNQSHDFMQLVHLVRGHAETLLLEKFPNQAPHKAAERLPTEGAIYFSTELMIVKMDSMLFLNEINRVHGNEIRFQIHPFFKKYLHIYRWQANQKDLSIRVDGHYYGHSRYNSEAIGAVLQGLMDNMVKYAPAGSEAVVTFTDQGDTALLSFASLGPRIEFDEVDQIFLPSYRARAARRVETGGMGVGLATAKQISDALDLDLQVHQDAQEHPDHPDRYLTTFTFQVDTDT